MISRSVCLLALLLGCCSPPEQGSQEGELLREAEVDTLEQVVRMPWRLAPERDIARHPVETLRFFGVGHSDTVIELWPGGGWYSSILAPWLKAGGGRLIAAGFDASSGDFASRAQQAYIETFQGRPEIFGVVEMRVLSADSGALALAGTADVVLTFRNVHNWLAGGYARKVFSDAFAALKPGGVLGVVEHRLPSGMQQLPGAPSGYVHEELVVGLAERAGFVLEAVSEINANLRDGADHPYGVWTLPPTLRTAPRGSQPDPDFDNSRYRSIGESDRMTLRFRKPEP